MLQAVYQSSLKRQNVLLMIVLFILFFSLYAFLDFEGSTSYRVMTETFGIGTTIIHIAINIIIAALSSIMVTFSILNYKLTNVEPVGSNAIPFFTFLFGILTFGCTSCVVAFLGAIGIAFTPLILPNANLLWKIIALLFVVLGFTWIMYSIQKAQCKIKQ